MAIPLFDAADRAVSEPAAIDPALPSFTTAIRGYQKEEVHNFLRELRNEYGDEARERHRLEFEAHDLRQRIATLERSIGSQTPHTIDALGERMLLILHHAETAAADAVRQATERAEQLQREAAVRAEAHVRQASLRASQAAQTLSAAKAEAQTELREARRTIVAERDQLIGTSQRTASELVVGAQRQADTLVDEAERLAEGLLSAAQGQAGSLVDAAERTAAAVLADAQLRAETQVSEAEAHATQLRARAAREEAAASDQISERRALADAQMDALADQRDDLLAEMAEIHAALARTLRASGFMDELKDENPTREQPVVVG